MDPTAPQKTPATPTNPQQRGEPATVGARPEPTLQAGGNVLDGLEAAVAAENIPHGPTKEAIAADLHKEQTIPKLRTFESDAAEAVKKHSVSAVSIAAQQIQQPSITPVPRRRETATRTIKKVAIIFGIFALVIGSGALIWYAITLSQPKTLPATQSNALTSTPIGVDDVKTIGIEPSQSTLSVFSQAKSSLATEKGTVVQFIMTPAGTTTPIDSGTFLTDLGAKGMPNWLQRATGPKYVVGYYHNTNSWDPFMLFEVSSYDNAFAAMLQWESSLATDLAPLYQSASPSSAATMSTTTASSTPVVLSLPPSWGDVYIDNKDVRAWGVPGQKPLLMYAFPMQNILVITTSQEAAIAIFNRLVARQFVR